MYIPALDPPLSGVGISDESVRSRAEKYGQAMLKLALLTGACPTISENQAFDSRAVLRAALDPAFRNLIRKGHIKLAYLYPDRDYRAALAEFVTRATSISPGWGSIESHDLRSVLLRPRALPPDDWDEEEKLLFEGLRYISAIPKDPSMLVRMPKVNLSSRLSKIITQLGSLFPDEDIHRPIQEYLRAVMGTLSEAEINTRSAWIKKALDPEFNNRFSSALEIGASNATIALAVVTYHEMLSESVSEGSALRSVAFTPFGVGSAELADVVPSQLHLLSVDRGGLLVNRSRGAPRSIIRVSDWFTPSEEDIDKLAALPWELVQTIVTHELFSQSVSDAMRSEEGLDSYLAWLKREIGVAFIEAHSRSESRLTRSLTDVVFKAVLTASSGAIGIGLDWILTAAGLKSVVSHHLQKFLARERAWGVEASVDVLSKAIDRAAVPSRDVDRSDSRPEPR